MTKLWPRRKPRLDTPPPSPKYTTINNIYHSPYSPDNYVYTPPASVPQVMISATPSPLGFSLQALPTWGTGADPSGTGQLTFTTPLPQIQSQQLPQSQFFLCTPVSAPNQLLLSSTPPKALEPLPSSSNRAAIQNYRRDPTPRDDLKPTRFSPLHGHLMNIRWDIRFPLEKARATRISGHGSLRIDKGARAAFRGIKEIEMGIDTDIGCGSAVTDILDALFRTTWQYGPVASGKSEELTVEHVLSVLRNYWLEDLTQEEIHFITRQRKYQRLVDGNHERSQLVGQYFSNGDRGKFRRIDFLGDCTLFNGFEVGDGSDDGTLSVLCRFGSVR